MNDTPQHLGAGSDADGPIERLLESHLAIKPLSPATIERLRGSVLQAWWSLYVPVSTSARARIVGNWKRPAAWAVAAGAAVAAIGLFALKPSDTRATFGSVARISGGGIVVGAGILGQRAVAPGDPLYVGETIRAKGSALLVLSAGGTLRLAKGTRIVILGSSLMTLARGTLYLDKPPSLVNAPPLQLETRFGLVEHSGTEFELLSNDQGVRIRVREGQVRFSGATGTIIAAAGTEVTAGPDGHTTEQPVPTYGSDWQWTAALAPDFAVEGHTLDEYLQWICRELGRPLQYANGAARDRARRTILHGRTLSPATLDALADVLASTTMTYELVGGAIRIHSDL